MDRRKSNALIEYGVLLVIVTAALFSMQYILSRHIKARIKQESDLKLGHGQGLEWSLSIGGGRSSMEYNKQESIGGNLESQAVSSSFSVTYMPPTPPYVLEHKGSALHVQDAATMPPVDSYPQESTNNYEEEPFVYQ